jgi:hypothetical protein
MRQCFIHIGTHKTATTSIQKLLNGNPQQLAMRGYLYPRAGRPEQASAGHHNIAWEISGDRRFRSDRGTVKDLIREIAATNLNIIISSEDFECSAHHDERFEEFIAAIRKLGIHISLVVYLRNQIDYAESLYCTLVWFGCTQPFSIFCDEILATGAIRWREWIFPFRYEDFVAKLASLAEVEIVVRSYDRPAMGSPILDFFSTVGISESITFSEDLPRENQRRNLSESVRHYWNNRTGQSLDDGDLDSIAAPFREYKARWPTMSLAHQLRFAEAFDQGNLRLSKRFQMPAFERMQQGQLLAAAGPSLDDVFGLDVHAVLASKEASDRC